MTLPELREQKGRLANEADQILKAAAEDGRHDLREDEDKKFDSIHADIEKLTKQIQRMEKQQATMESLETSTGRRSDANQPEHRSGGTERTGRLGRATQYEHNEALRAWSLAACADVQPTPEQRAVAQKCGINIDSKRLNFQLSPVAMRMQDDGRQPDVESWNKRMTEERAAMGTTSGAVGLYTVPDEMMRGLETAMLAFGGMRQVATVIRTSSGADLPIPTSDDTSNKGAILAENTAVSEVDITFEQLVLQAYKYSSKLVLVSAELLQDSSINVGAMIGEKLGERIGRITNDHFTTGTGSSQPNGIVTAGTSSSVTLTGTATISYDNIVDLIHSVDPSYRVNGKFMFHDGMLKIIKKIKVLQYSGDTVGMPLWTPGLIASQPDTILGYTYLINQSMTTPATAVKSILFGDLSKYIIRDTRDVTLLRLDERYAEYHQVGFLAFSRHDGDLLDAGTHPVKYATQA